MWMWVMPMQQKLDKRSKLMFYMVYLEQSQKRATYAFIMKIEIHKY